MRSKTTRCRALPWLGLASLTLWAHPSTAGPFDDPGYAISEMVRWASEVDSLVRGPMDAANPTAGNASYGAEADVVGPAAGDMNTVLSLGDGGEITLAFSLAITNGPGDDFAVFENGFYQGELGLFAELAHVEVSTNGVDFARFESETLHGTPVPMYGVVDPTDFDNFAGDQDLGWGTGFDLSELSGHPLVGASLLDLDDVVYVRVIDVVGDGSTLDGFGSSIYDPYPTPFPSGGFDLDGVGVLQPAPEPETALLLLAGCAMLPMLRRLRCACTD